MDLNSIEGVDSHSTTSIDSTGTDIFRVDRTDGFDSERIYIW
jgi:hypothetical protein